MCAGVLLVGCAGPNKAESPLPSTAEAADAPAAPSRLQQAIAQAELPRDPVKTGVQMFQLEFYSLAVPRGFISGNAEFWKPFDETFLGFDVHTMLDSNGLRVGKAPLTELKALTDQLIEAETTHESLIGLKGKDFEMPVRGGIERQTVNVFDVGGRQNMRDFDKCENLFAINFRQAPRQPDHVQLAIAPAVREGARRLTLNGDSGGVEWVKPRSLYDLAIRLELAANECLVIAPGPRALDNSLSVGRIFLMERTPRGGDREGARRRADHPRPAAGRRSRCGPRR